MRTVGQHIALMRHALGKSPATGHDLYQTFTDAINQLCDMEWIWARRGPVALPFVAGQEWVELPEDFGRVVALETPSTTVNSVIQTTAQHIAALRSGVVGFPDIQTYLAFDAARGQNSPGVPSRVVAQVWPTPSANGSPVVRLTYQRGFGRFAAADDNITPDIDRSADLLLSFMAQDLAFLIENKRSLFDPIVIENETARVKLLDGSRQWSFGQMSGGALDRLPSQTECVPIDTITVT